LNQTGGNGRVILSVLEPGAEETRARLAGAPAGTGLVEIRADHLTPDSTAGLVRDCRLPVIVTVRRRSEGGAFDGGEEAREAILRSALSAGARYVDVEWGSALAAWADDPALAGRVILSDHSVACDAAELAARYASMAGRRAAVLKLVPECKRPAEGEAIWSLLRRAAADGRRLACFGSGRAGALTRLLALSWGSWATYGSASAGRESAAGQFTARDLIETHHVTEIRSTTRRFAILGSRVFGSPSPAMHTACYRDQGMDARYFPVETDDFGAFRELVEARDVWGLDGLAVTIPFKEAAARRCAELDRIAREAGAVNTVLVRPAGWAGFNTDGPAILGLIRARLDPAGRRVAVLGAGGTARTAAAVLRDAGASVTLFARNRERLRSAGEDLGLDWAIDERLSEQAWEILVHATPRGGDGERFLPSGELRGELVLDAVYRRDATRLVEDARKRGLHAIDGFQLLVEQARLQYQRLTGAPADPERMAAAGMQWLSSRPA